MAQVIKYAELQEYMAQTNTLSAEAQKKLSQVWGQLSSFHIDEARDILAASMTGLVAEYGDAAALMTAEFMSRYSPNQTRFDYIAPQGISAERIDQRVRSAVRHWANGVPESTIKELYGSLDRYIKYSGRESVIEAAKRHKQLRFAVVPRPGCICSWCLMMASRGFIYYSKDRANQARFHDNCSCSVVQGWQYPDGSTTQVEGYDPSMLERRWREIEAGNITFQKGAVPLDKELDVGVFLAEAGHKVQFLKENRKQRMADSLVDNATREFKVPEGNQNGSTNWRNNAKTQLESVLYDRHGNFNPQAFDVLVSTHKVNENVGVERYGRYLIEAWSLPELSVLKSVWLVDSGGVILPLEK